MRQKRKDSIFDNFFMPLAVVIASGIIGGVLTFLGIKNSDPAYVFHDVITYDNVSDIIETYFVDYGLVDASILDLESPQEQMRMIRDIIQEQQRASNETASRIDDLLLTIGYDPEIVEAMDEEEIFDILSSYLASAEADRDALAELSSKTLSDLSAPSLVIQGESIDTTLQDYVAVINGKNFYQETFLNTYILDEQISLSDGVLRYADSAPERMKVTDAVMHDNSNFVIVQETSDYIIGTETCTYGLVTKGVHNSIYIECGGDYSEFVFDLGHINDTGDTGKELHIYYLDADGEYKETYSCQLKANMPYLKNESCPIYNTQTLKITIDGRYINQYDHYGLVNMYLVK